MADQKSGTEKTIERLSLPNVPISVFPEKKFETECETYARTLKQGYARAQITDISIGLLARDVAKHLPYTSKWINYFSSLFNSCKVFVYENDSKDGTKLVLEEWARRNSNVHLLSETLHKKKWPQMRSGDRGADMADYRSRLQRFILTGREPHCVLIMDADLAGISIDGMMHSLGRWHSWDVCASNGLVRRNYKWQQFDAWAFREMGSWEPIQYKDIKDHTPHRGQPLQAVYSAFGGAALYKASAYEHGVYRGGDCEHVTFHGSIYAGGMIMFNPSQITVYRY